MASMEAELSATQWSSSPFSLPEQSAEVTMSQPYTQVGQPMAVVIHSYPPWAELPELCLRIEGEAHPFSVTLRGLHHPRTWRSQRLSPGHDGLYHLDWIDPSMLVDHDSGTKDLHLEVKNAQGEIIYRQQFTFVADRRASATLSQEHDLMSSTHPMSSAGVGGTA
jgi:hypothetical protein